MGYCHWENAGKISSNPLSFLDGAISSDITPPLFQNFSLTNGELGYPIDIVDDSSNFDNPTSYWDSYQDTEGDPNNHYNNVSKNQCSWKIRGKVDIWVKAVDFMNTKGTFHQKYTHPFDPFDIYPTVNKIEYDIKKL